MEGLNKIIITNLPYLGVQEEMQYKSFVNKATKYLFPWIKFANIDFLCIQNLSEYY